MESVKSKSIMEMEKKKKKPSEKSESSMGDLPIDITREILTRLAVKPILRFRSVSKTWHSIIDNPQFRAMHYLMMMRRSSSSTPSSSFVLCNKEGGNLTIVEDEECGTLKSSKIKFDYSDYWGIDKSYLVGSCNGLLCLSSFDNRAFIKPPHKTKYSMFIICNPVTRDYLKLPHIVTFNVVASFSYGFGVDTITKEFKVVIILHFFRKKFIWTTEVWMYTLGFNSWKNVCHVPTDGTHMPLGRGSGLFLNGSVHWNKFNPGTMWFDIVSFDLSSERFGVIQKPDSLFNMPISDIQFGALGNCLYLSHHDRANGCYNIWVMKEYKVRESWTKQIVIRKSILNEIGSISRVIPVLIRTNGELALLCNSRFLVSYNLESGNATLLESWESQELDHSMVRFHASLVSPNQLNFINSRIESNH